MKKDAVQAQNTFLEKVGRLGLGIQEQSIYLVLC